MLFVVIPVHNRKTLTRACLCSLAGQDYRGFSTVVIDDASSDGTGAMLRREFPAVLVLQGNGDYWWSRCVNLGIRHALQRGATHIVTLNDDVVVDPDYIATLVDGATMKPHCLVCSAGYDIESRRTLLYCGERIDWATARYSSPCPDSAGVLPEFVDADLLPGRGLLIPREVFETVGLFDASAFPQSAADYDFSCRARKAGYPTLCYLKSKVFCQSDSRSLARYMRERSLANFLAYLFSKRSAANLSTRFTFAMKNCPPLFLPSFLLLDTMRTIGSYFRAVPKQQRRSS